MTEIKYLITFRGQEDVKQAKDVTVTCNNHGTNLSTFHFSSCFVVCLKKLN